MYTFTIPFDVQKHYILCKCMSWAYDGGTNVWVDRWVRVWMDRWTLMDKNRNRQCLCVLTNEVWIDRRSYIIRMISLYAECVEFSPVHKE
jgi:hypothetical protein